MEQLLEIARKSADQVEIYSRAVSTDSVSFENGKLKDIDSKILSGVSVRLFKASKVGIACTQNLVDREELVHVAGIGHAEGRERIFHGEILLAES